MTESDRYESDIARAAELQAYFKSVGDGVAWLTLAAKTFTMCTDNRPDVQALCLVRHPGYRNPAHLLAMTYRIPT